MKKPTFTVKGRFLSGLNKNSLGAQALSGKEKVACSVSQSSSAVVQKFDWENALIDASITSAITFFGALGGGAIAGINSITVLESAVIAALSQFFVFLGLKRGLIQPNNN